MESDKFFKIARKGRVRIIGLMSGTSHDGVDAALVEIRPLCKKYSSVRSPGYDEIRIKLIKHIHTPYTKSLRNEISEAFKGDAEHICRLNFKLGGIFARAALTILKSTGFRPEDIDAIASHGQTIYHIPPSRRKFGSTLQIGEASVIAEKTGVLTICDFRVRDMASGGQGAPLVPLADYLIFHKRGKIRAVLNIGGIANVTIVKERINDTIAFDTGPGNSLIDEAIKLYSEGRRTFDKDGSLAESGRPDKGLLDELLSHPYFKKRPPKSTGREAFGKDLVKNILKRYGNLSAEDILSTLAHLTAISIYKSIISFGPHEVIVSGGGVKNKFLMWLINTLFKNKGIPVHNISKYGIPPDAKEAISFAILGYQTLNLKPGNLPSATGASNRVILGKIIPP